MGKKQHTEDQCQSLGKNGDHGKVQKKERLGGPKKGIAKKKLRF